MLNWVKIRVWEQVQWDGIIMIDVDVTVLGDLTHLFHLPTDFAAVPDNGKVRNRYAAAACCNVSQTVLYSTCQGFLALHKPACASEQLWIFLWLTDNAQQSEW